MLENSTHESISASYILYFSRLVIPLYMIKHSIALLLILFSLPGLIAGQDTGSLSASRTSTGETDRWVDSVLTSLTLEEQIAQLLMIRTYSNKDESYYAQMEQLVREYNLGGLCFFQGGPVMQAKLTNRYQGIAKTPLFIAMDAEWGLGMRLDSTYSFPYQMTLGAGNNDTLLYLMGEEVARQLKTLGVHINFAPVVDVNNNPNNPVINSRSFGEDKQRVAAKAAAYMKALAKRALATEDTGRIVHARRLAAARLADDEIVRKLFDEIAPRYSERNGGYTRMLKLGRREGDSSEMVILELVE